MLCPIRLDIDELEASSPAIIDATLLKSHVRIDFDDDNSLIDLYVQAAVRWAEGVTQRTIVQRSHQWVLRDFGSSANEEIRLPRGKTASVESITYSVNGSTTTITGPSSSPAGTDYQEDLRGDSGGVLMPTRGSSWPSVDADVPAPVVISFTAGWAQDQIPADLLNALMFFVADCYELRGETDFLPHMAQSGGARFMARWNLISGYCLPRVY